VADLNVGQKMTALSADRSRVIRVAGSTYVVIGFLSALPFFAGIGLLAEGRTIVGVFCLALSLATFYHFCFQKIVFQAAVMSFRRPLLREQRVDLARVDRVSVFLESAGQGFMWRCRIFDGEHLLCEFNPKLFSFAGLDVMFAEIRTYAPAVVIEDGTAGVRAKKKPNQAPEPKAPSGRVSS
jgi:hypothetical protein